MDIFIRFIADGLVLVIAAIGAYFLIFKLPKGSNRLHAYARIVMAGLTAVLAAKLVASFYQPDVARPFVELGVAAKAAYLDNAGFPSDHVLFTSAIAYAVWFETKQKNIAILLFILVAFVALGRVLALVHSPTDVLGGFVFASFGALWYLTKPKKQF
ncbi:MAG: phosphatase PAP2 family protein [Candidatus Saccharibacteria bacterium]|nr:phosphatase PAP2 family protein [Candidatus Saccharibacteria bacterium]